MRTATADLTGEVTTAHAELAAVLAGIDERMLHDDPLLQLTATIERAGMLLDSWRVRLAGEVGTRSRRELGEDRLSAKKGCRNAVELLARLTLASERTVGQRIRLGEATRP